MAKRKETTGQGNGRATGNGGGSSKPNFLIIWGDDIGTTNLSCYSKGLMGYRTPNIDRIANEGTIFTDGYGEQSCTAGRSSFITGQSCFRTGLSKVGIPGPPISGTESKDHRSVGRLLLVGSGELKAAGQHGVDRDPVTFELEEDEFAPTVDLAQPLSDEPGQLGRRATDGERRGRLGTLDRPTGQCSVEGVRHDLQIGQLGHGARL